jgi:hypothetical protein
MKQDKDQKYEVYNHRILWTAACKNFNAAKCSENDAMFFYLGAMLLVYLSFEAYLNYLGDSIAKEVWEVERDFFSRPPYKGSLGKYRYLAKILLLPSPNKSCRPYQTAVELAKLRDMVVHAHPEIGTRSVKISDAHFPPLYKSKLAERVSSTKAERAKKDIGKLTTDIHDAACLHYSDLVTVSSPFGGMLGFQITNA